MKAPPARAGGRRGETKENRQEQGQEAASNLVRCGPAGIPGLATPSAAPHPMPGAWRRLEPGAQPGLLSTPQAPTTRKGESLLGAGDNPFYLPGTLPSRPGLGGKFPISVSQPGIGTSPGPPTTAIEMPCSAPKERKTQRPKDIPSQRTHTRPK